MIRSVHTHQFPAMGSTVEITLVGGNSRAATQTFVSAIELAAEWETTFSRFRPHSELSQLNTRAGRLVPVSPRLLRGIRAAVHARAATQGLFDPTMLPALLALGYDRSFEQLERNPPGGGESPRLAVAHASIEILPAQQLVRLPAGVMLDLGGIAKGMFVDTLASSLAEWPGGVVSAGGDLRLWGVSPSGERWIVGVEDPDDPQQDVAQLELCAGSVATSSNNRRAWYVAGERRHHLIDPRSGLPAVSSVRSVTVVAASTQQAEVAAKALFVGGIAPEQLSQLACPFAIALVVLKTGAIQTVRGTGSMNIDVQTHIAA